MMIKKVLQAFYGKLLWEKYIKLADYIILCPHFEDEYNIAALESIDELLDEKMADSALFLTVSSCYKDISHYTKKAKSKVISQAEANAITKLYELYFFDDRLYIATLGKVNGRITENIIGYKGHTVKELLDLTVFFLQDKYTSEDDLKELYGIK